MQKRKKRGYLVGEEYLRNGAYKTVGPRTIGARSTLYGDGWQGNQAGPYKLAQDYSWADAAVAIQRVLRGHHARLFVQQLLFTLAEQGLRMRHSQMKLRLEQDAD